MRDSIMLCVICCMDCAGSNYPLVEQMFAGVETTFTHNASGCFLGLSVFLSKHGNCFFSLLSSSFYIFWDLRVTFPRILKVLGRKAFVSKKQRSPNQIFFFMLNVKKMPLIENGKLRLFRRLSWAAKQTYPLCHER